MFEVGRHPDPTETAAPVGEDRAAGLLAVIAECERAVARAQAAQLAAIAALDAAWAGGPCAEFVAEEVALGLRVSSAAARSRVELARTLTGRLPGTLAALGRGEIDLYKARAIAEAADRVDGDGPARAVEARVLPGAAGQTGAQLKAALRRAVLAADPAGAEARHARAVRGRRVELVALDDGMAAVSAVLAADHAVAVVRMLDGLARAARGEPGETRTLDQLRADALAEIAVGVLDGAGWAGRAVRARRRARAHLCVLVGADTLLGVGDEPGWLAGYGPIPASMARRIARDATWRRLLTDPPSGALLDYGTTRYAPGAVLDGHVERVRWSVYGRCVGVWSDGCDFRRKGAPRVHIDHGGADPDGGR